MDKIFYLLILLLSGFGLGIQGSVNGALGKTTGALQAAFISFLIGSMSLFIVLLVMGKGNLSAVFHVPKWQLIGGFLGAFYVTMLAFAVPKIGIGLAIVSVVIGQLLMSLVIDHFGLFQSTQILLNSQRVIGFLLLVAGMIFIYRGT